MTKKKKKKSNVKPPAAGLEKGAALLPAPAQAPGCGATSQHRVVVPSSEGPPFSQCHLRETVRFPFAFACCNSPFGHCSAGIKMLVSFQSSLCFPSAGLTDALFVFHRFRTITQGYFFITISTTFLLKIWA